MVQELLEKEALGCCGQIGQRQRLRPGEEYMDMGKICR